MCFHVNNSGPQRSNSLWTWKGPAPRVNTFHPHGSSPHFISLSLTPRATHGFPQKAPGADQHVWHSVAPWPPGHANRWVGVTGGHKVETSRDSLERGLRAKNHRIAKKARAGGWEVTFVRHYRPPGSLRGVKPSHLPVSNVDLTWNAWQLTEKSIPRWDELFNSMLALNLADTAVCSLALFLCGKSEI